MDSDRYFLTGRQVERIARQVVRGELEAKGNVQHKIDPTPVSIDCVAGIAYGAISAMVGDTPGTGYVHAKKFIEGTAAEYSNEFWHQLPVLNVNSHVIPSGAYVVVHRHRESRKWMVSANVTTLVSIQSATGDTALTGSFANMPVGNGADVLPSWLTINGSSEIVVADSVVGRYLRFSGLLGVRRDGTASTSNMAEVSIEGMANFLGAIGVVLWLGEYYIPSDTASERFGRCPSFTYGPLKSGDKFRIRARKTVGSDTVNYIGGVSDYRLDIQLLEGVGYGTRVS